MSETPDLLAALAASIERARASRPWPEPLPCPPLGPELEVDDETLTHPAKTPSLFHEADQDGAP